MALTDTVDWPTAFLGCLKAGIIAVPVNTLLTEDDYRFMLADSRAKCLVVSEALFPKFEKLIGKAPTSITSSSRATTRTAIGCSRTCIGADEPEPYTAPTTADDMAFWLYTSGSTGKPKGAVHVHASLKLTADLYGTPVAGLKESDVCLFGGEIVLRLRPRQRHDVSAVGRRHDRAQRRAADAGRRRGACCASIRSRCSSRCRRSMRRSSTARTRRRSDEVKIRRCHFGRRSAAGGDRAQMARALRRRNFRRPRHHRDAAHLSHQ